MAITTILVTGDHGIDLDIYLHSDEDNPPPGTPPTVVRANYGGSGIAHRVLGAAQAGVAGAFETRFLPLEQAAGSPTAAIWSGFELGDLGVAPADQKSKVWRTRRSTNLGRLENPAILPHPPAGLPDDSADPGCQPDILVIEDDGAGLRVGVPDPLSKLLEAGPDALPHHIVLKTCAPVGHGALWWLLTGRTELADRLVVVVSISDLRRADVRISQGISWERTAEELAQELVASPALSALREARHVIVTLQSEGALWMERPGDANAPSRTRLVFDPGSMEGEWPGRAGVKGGAYGFHAAFSAAVACRLAIDQAAGDETAIARGIERGLLAVRSLRVLGHGPMNAASPGLPAAELGQVLTSEGLGEMAAGSRAPVAWARLGSFGRAEVPAADTRGATWRMIEATDRELSGHPLYGKAHRIALLGSAALENVPHARFGRLFTADREEIEALRNLKRLMDAYSDSRIETKPLSLAVFGPSGAGKSFGIRQIAESVIEDRRRAFLEFNLSQFDDPGDLTGALHQVRDKVLEGKLPVVYWDEFDSQDYRWLQYLLAPMQDGKFQEGQLTHPIGPCVFVFEGATSYTFEAFGPPDQPASGGAAEQEPHRKAVADFKLKKGPDFKSRLHGYLDVFGPNPRQRFTGKAWEDDPADVCFPVRRAILLRSMLGLMDERNGAKRLEMDPGLLAALLESRYEHGARSFEKIVDTVKRSGGGYRRSALPSDEVLEMNLADVPAFKSVLGRRGTLQPHATLIAAALHARWLGTADAESRFAKAFEELPAEVRGDNVAAAMRIGDIMALAGLDLVAKRDPRAAIEGADRVLANHLETLAEEEHRGWLDVRLKNGWRPCERTDDAALKGAQREERKSDCLVPYRDLPEDERDKDRDTIRWYPKAAALAGLKIVATGERPRSR